MLQFENKLIEFLVSGVVYTIFTIISVLIIPSIFGLNRDIVLGMKRYLVKQKVK